jgi:heme exporter protein CcmD
MPEFDKNAIYIWACFGIGAVLIAAAAIQSLLAARAARLKLERLEKTEAAQ